MRDTVGLVDLAPTLADLAEWPFLEGCKQPMGQSTAFRTRVRSAIGARSKFAPCWLAAATIPNAFRGSSERNTRCGRIAGNTSDRVMAQTNSTTSIATAKSCATCTMSGPRRCSAGGGARRAPRPLPAPESRSRAEPRGAPRAGGDGVRETLIPPASPDPPMHAVLREGRGRDPVSDLAACLPMCQLRSMP